MFTLNCRGKLWVIDQPVVMGILNVTPDSFYQGSRVPPEMALKLAGNMIEEGADILDIGGQSTRPGSDRLEEEEELKRVIPVIQKIHQEFPDMLLSVDTFYSRVAAEAIGAGASVVNDVSAGNEDPLMIKTVAGLGAPYIAMHMKGKPKTMQVNPNYENVTQEVLDFFIQKSEACQKEGIVDLIVDPGFGFGKTNRHNFELLKNLSQFKILDRPLLAGVSRKGMVYKTLGIDADAALNGTTVLHTLCLLNGANMLRVHDVKEAKESIRLVQEYISIS